MEVYRRVLIVGNLYSLRDLAVEFDWEKVVVEKTYVIVLIQINK